jgi:hypothetical protein
MSVNTTDSLGSLFSTDSGSVDAKFTSPSGSTSVGSIGIDVAGIVEVGCSFQSLLV